MQAIPMKHLTHLAMEFLKEEDGPTATEYSVMLAGIILVCIVIVGFLGSSVSTMFHGPQLSSALGS